MSGQTSLRQPLEPGVAPGRSPSFLLICDEWSPTRGGISRFNRCLATALAAAGHRTCCLVESASAQETLDAKERNVTLLTAEWTPAGPNLYVRAQSVLDESPDVVIGHDIVSGAVAWTYARMYLQTAALVHIVHTAPAHVEPYKRDDDATRRTEEREKMTRHVCAHADVVAAVGPRLTRSADAMVGDGFGGVSVLQLDPGMDIPAGVADRLRHVPTNPTVLVLGRGGHIQPKGLDIAAQAVAGLTVPHGRPTPELLVRGAPPDRCDWLRRLLVDGSGLARDRIDVRPFTDDIDQIEHDLKRAALCVMPSRVEGFGLSALEAIGLGTPVLVSAKSGLAETLRIHLGTLAEPMIVDVVDDISQDAPRWRDAMQKVLDNLPAAFEYAHLVRSRLQEVLRWDMTVSTLTTRLAIPAQRRVSHR
jgi:glycosyltransferase involved in cell wall biosynthesis